MVYLFLDHVLVKKLSNSRSPHESSLSSFPFSPLPPLRAFVDSGTLKFPLPLSVCATVYLGSLCVIRGEGGEKRVGGGEGRRKKG